MADRNRETICTFFYVFYVFFKIQKNMTFYVFFQLLHTFSPAVGIVVVFQRPLQLQNSN